MEDDGSGNLYETTADFKDYDSIADGLRDHNELLKHYGLSKDMTAEEQANKLQGTYATDSSYAAKLMQIINDNNLTQYDGYRTGTPFLPDDQVILAHQGELIVPQHQNPMANPSRLNLNNDDVVEAINNMSTNLANLLNMLVTASSSDRVPADLTFSSEKIFNLGGQL